MRQSRKKAQKVKNMTVTLKSEGEIVVPQKIRRKAGWKTGEQVEFTVSGRTITMSPRSSDSDDEYTPAERRAIDRGIAQSEKDYREGRFFGPFATAKEFIASLHKESAKLRAKEKTKRSAK
jgi:AbrB family looped-hinge helix DNA binding protein